MSKPKPLADDIRFLFEMGNMRLIKRMGSRFLGSFDGDLADHHFRVFWIAMVIAAHEDHANTGKIAKLALLHDIAESRTGDVDYLARQYVERNEKLAIEDMLEGTAVKAEFYALWQEYETRESLESKIVKDADNLDVDFELIEHAAMGHTLPELWYTHRKERAKRLYTATARHIYEQLKDSNPHAWHMDGRNRLNAGDWKET